MKDHQPDIKQKNYRAWKSGKKWLYASVALASIVGGAVLESTGIAPKVLSYIQKAVSTDVALAMSESPTILMRGAVLQPNFFASVGDFTVPATVGQDFANNAGISIKGSINARFEGSTFVIPSADDSNAIAVFNQPLDPSKDFSISAEVRVPNAKIAAAGLYISDVAPNDIVSMLGVGDWNGEGSSGALKNQESAYKNHYMLFSGFHNSGGFVAVMASGSDYTRMSSGTAGIGPSRYMDNDWIDLWGENKNLTVWADITYSAATGIAKVTYRHNSATTATGVGQYKKDKKSATVEIRIDDKTSPVYLGIVGNGDDSSNRDLKTSRSIVTSVTGTYLSKERYVEFKDDAGNPLLAPSKVLMPRGGRLGIGNNDSTTPYYFDKPDVRQGFTYRESQNPSVGGDKNVVVTYQRDTQTGYVERINKATGKKLDPSQNYVIKGLTEQELSIKVPGLSGYYYVEDISGEAKNPVYASDGSTVDFKMTMDDTANGTSTTDSQEQVVQTYVMPSVQERILNVKMPDGKTVTEKQTSTTGTDFLAIAGEYAIPGYRVVIDGVPVSDAEANKGIPEEATDNTNNLKAATDSVPQIHTITYQVERQKASVVYKDLTTGSILATDPIEGDSDALMAYDTASKISKYAADGYVLKSNNFKDGSEKFDLDTSVDQDYLVELVRDSKNTLESKTITHEVSYSVKHNLVPAPEDYMTTATITHNYFVDRVTGDKITSKYADYAVNGVLSDSPEAPKYESNHLDAKVTQVGQITFTSPKLPTVSDHVPTVSENTTIHFNTALDGQKLQSTVLYQLDDTINVTVPINTIFYNKTTDKDIKAPTYKITNNSGAPVKVSVAGFKAGMTNPAMPNDFALNLKVSGNQVKTPSTTLVENGLAQTSTVELVTLANCLDQYADLDAAVAKGSAVNNVANFTYGGSATTSDVRKLGYTLSLKFDGIKF